MVEHNERESELLGEIICPSGILVILDGGLAWMWSHNRPPLLPEWSDIAESANSSVDLAIRGPDALRAGIAFDRQLDPYFLYDIPEQGLSQTTSDFLDLVRSRNFSARLEQLPERIPHRQRVDSALSNGRGVGVVQFHGMWAPVANDVPKDQPLPVRGLRIAEGPNAGRWHRVWIDVRAGEVSQTRAIGDVLVDEARLMAVDADALGLWNDSDSLDGKADTVFWGRDAERVAKELGAPSLEIPGESNVFGWRDLAVEDALAKGALLRAAKSDDCWFAFDYRPHTHHWQVMRDVRASNTESGVLDLGDAKLCMFMTSWGDGGFPVEADLDAEGRLLRLRMEVGCEDIVARQRALDES